MEESDPTASAAKVPTKQRIVSEAMRLFGEQGYAATTVAQIEAAAGLRSGSGGLYRHVASKRELLEQGVRAQMARRSDLVSFVADPGRLVTMDLRERLTAVARAGIARLDAERDLNRILIRDLRHFPDLMHLVQTEELNGIRAALSAWLESQAPSSHVDWDALAWVLMGAISHYWVLSDSLGGFPAEVDEERYIAALVDLVVVRFGNLPTKVSDHVRP